MDIAFVVDSSDNVNAEEYEKQKALVISIARKIGISKNYTRGALVPYGDSASVYFRFEDSMSIASFENAVVKMPHKKGRSRLDRAINVTSRSVFSTSRLGVPKIAFVIASDKQPPDAKGLAAASDTLRKEGVKVIVVGVGSEINPQELNAIVKNDENAHAVQSFGQLFLEGKNMSQKICEAAGW